MAGMQSDYRVMFLYSIERSCRFSIVMIEESAEWRPVPAAMAKSRTVFTKLSRW